MIDRNINNSGVIDRSSIATEWSTNGFSSELHAEVLRCCGRPPLAPAHLPNYALATIPHATLLISYHTDRTRDADGEQREHTNLQYTYNVAGFTPILRYSTASNALETFGDSPHPTSPCSFQIPRRFSKRNVPCIQFSPKARRHVELLH
jgi:hypothetical protein